MPRRGIARQLQLQLHPGFAALDSGYVFCYLACDETLLMGFISCFGDSRS
jgi:hypothetical protein